MVKNEGFSIRYVKNYIRVIFYYRVFCIAKNIACYRVMCPPWHNFYKKVKTVCIVAAVGTTMLRIAELLIATTTTRLTATTILACVWLVPLVAQENLLNRKIPCLIFLDRIAGEPFWFPSLFCFSSI